MLNSPVKESTYLSDNLLADVAAFYLETLELCSGDRLGLDSMLYYFQYTTAYSFTNLFLFIFFLLERKYLKFTY